jgi:hypothetical protein
MQKPVCTGWTAGREALSSQDRLVPRLGSAIMYSEPSFQISAKLAHSIGINRSMTLWPGPSLLHLHDEYRLIVERRGVELIQFGKDRGHHVRRRKTTTGSHHVCQAAPAVFRAGGIHVIGDAV